MGYDRLNNGDKSPMLLPCFLLLVVRTKAELWQACDSPPGGPRTPRPLPYKLGILSVGLRHNPFAALLHLPTSSPLIIQAGSCKDASNRILHVETGTGGGEFGVRLVSVGIR